MSAIITEKFRQHNATQFHESFSESSGNAYYLTIGKSSPFTSATSGGSDDSPPTPVDDVTSEFYTWDSAIASKKIASLSVSLKTPPGRPYVPVPSVGNIKIAFPLVC